jgi:multidrug efflux system membrane fusion protein
LDPRPFEVALQQAEGVLARDRAQAANAQAQFKRYDDLMTRGLLPRDQFEAQRATAAALEATVGADAAAVEAAKLNLQYTRVEAPVAGRTGALMVHQGDLVRANDTAPMVTINQVAPIYVTFAVPGRLLADVRRYQAAAPLVARARVSGSEPTAEGHVTFIDNAVDTATDTIKLKATFANADRRLWPGSFVDVVLQLTTEPHAIVAPAAAVQASQQGQFVYVVKSDRSVAVQPVTVARMESGEAVIATGLKNGDTVVTDGQLRLTPGAHVTEAAATNSGAPAQ